MPTYQLPRQSPGQAGWRGLVAQDGTFDQAVRAVGGVEHLAGVVQTERLEVNQEMVLVGQGQPDLGDVPLAVQHGPTHRVQRLLQGAAVGAYERPYQLPAGLLV